MNYLKKLLVLVIFVSLVACSGNVQQAGPWLEDGSIVLSRTVPEANLTTSGRIFSFLPNNLEDNTTWLKINREAGTIEMANGLSVTEIKSGSNFDLLTPGTYKVIHKQENPLWYAPDEYFTSRNLDIPASGDKSRYLRGALGEFAIYISPEVPLHCGPFSLPELGGLQLDKAQLEMLYARLAVGSYVKVE